LRRSQEICHAAQSGALSTAAKLSGGKLGSFVFAHRIFEPLLCFQYWRFTFHRNEKYFCETA
jgi:hypothetical protein